MALLGLVFTAWCRCNMCFAQYWLQGYLKEDQNCALIEQIDQQTFQCLPQGLATIQILMNQVLPNLFFCKTLVLGFCPQVPIRVFTSFILYLSFLTFFLSCPLARLLEFQSVGLIPSVYPQTTEYTPCTGLHRFPYGLFQGPLNFTTLILQF